MQPHTQNDFALPSGKHCTQSLGRFGIFRCAGHCVGSGSTYKTPSHTRRNGPLLDRAALRFQVIKLRISGLSTLPYQTFSLPSAAALLQPGSASVCHSSEMSPFSQSFSRLPRRCRVPVGATRIMDMSTQPSCVVVLFPTFSLAPTFLPLRHLPPRPHGWTTSSLMPSTEPVSTPP